ncbi:F-box domain-containing protein [Mycena venus]|uniref:F-box domain-containing protein n=1 Tax=Mycena venus TaxID=2733690 RepID=A0A8H7D8G1_9AGAR|nr:F-box domain-containing protein [Mycena venus]
MSTMPPSEEISLCNSCNKTFIHSPLVPCDNLSGHLLKVLRTNLTGTNLREASDIRAIMARIPSELARYEAELGRLDEIFEKLVAGRNALQGLLDQCVSVVDAPVRRLPTEILVEVFKFCEEPRMWSQDPISPDSWEREMKRELRRVAGGDLFAFSQVSSHWRQVVLGTSTLWSKISVDMRCWTLPIVTMRTSLAHHRMVGFLEAALARGRQGPLTIEVNGLGTCHPLLLQILAASAHRWRHARFTVDCAMLKHLSPVARNLPLLETLCISALNENPETLDKVAKYFSRAPRLRTVDFGGPVSAVAHLPLEQLRCCSYSGLGPEDLRSLLGHMGRLQNTELHVQLNFDAIRVASPLDLTPVVSSIEELDICSMEHTGHETDRVLGQMFDALTLPGMRRLHLYGDKSGMPLYWPHHEGLGLLHRSESRATLQSLTLHDVLITESELLQCLAELPLLQYLFISDHPASPALPGNPVHHLVTDSLLQKLTPQPHTPIPCLVPNLAIVDLKTIGRFTDAAFLAFAAQRSLLAGAEEPFECALLWVPGHARQLDGDTTMFLISAMQMESLIFTSREYDPNEEDSS